MSTKGTDRAAYLAGRIAAALHDETDRETMRVTHDDGGTTMVFKSRGVPLVVRVEVTEWPA